MAEPGLRVKCLADEVQSTAATGDAARCNRLARSVLAGRPSSGQG